AAPLAAAPVPKDAVKPALYFPTTVGTERVYGTRFDGWVYHVDTVTKVETEGDVFRVTTVSSGRIENTRQVNEVSAGKGVVTVAKGFDGELKPCDPPRVVLKLPAKAGDTWTEEQKGDAGKVTTTYTVDKEAEVEAPAGKFKAIPVTVRSVRDGRAD